MNSCFTKQYGKLFMEIPVAITIENKTLNAKLSISDTDYGLICLTYQISAFVYAIALIVYGSKYSSKILSFVSSNAKTNEAKWDSNSKTFTCTIDTNNTNVVNARAILIKWNCQNSPAPGEHGILRTMYIDGSNYAM